MEKWKVDYSRKLPIGIQSFEYIRRNGYLYVDKTGFVYRLANLGKPYFLSRPRRFGKSLLLSTLKAYFLGQRELFKGLAIEDLETEWSEHAVLHLDLNAEKYDSPERHYQVIFYLVFKFLGQYTAAEVRSAKGRADAVVHTPDYIYVFEFKLTGTAEAALAQIDEKGYLLPYTADGRRLVKVGEEFDPSERNLGRWQTVEE